MTRLLLALIAILPLICSAEIYKWTDENGHVHFGDKPKDKDQADQLSLKINFYESVSYESSTPIQVLHRSASTYIPLRSVATSSRFWRNSVSFAEYDIQTNPNARRAYDAIGGNGAPVILKGNKRLDVFAITDFQGFYH